RLDVDGVDRAHEFVGVDRLGEVTLKASGQRAPSVLGTGVRRKRDGADRRSVRRTLDLPQPHDKVVAVEARHADVGQHDVDITLLESVQGFGRRGRDRHVCAGRLQYRADQRPRFGIVVDAQHAYADQQPFGPRCHRRRDRSCALGVTCAWKAHGEAGSASAAGALRTDGAAVRLDQVTDNGQPKSEAAVAARMRPVHLVKSIEDLRQLFGTDALARIAYDELDAVVGAAQADVNAAAGWRELQGVRNEVRDDLMQAVTVAPDDAAGLDRRR